MRVEAADLSALSSLVNRYCVVRTSPLIAVIALSLLCSFGSTPGYAENKATGELMGDPEIVFNWSKDRCDNYDIPDESLQAVHLADGSVLAFDTHFDARRFIGRDLNSIKRDCTVVYRSERNDDPSEFADRTWIGGLWSPDGKVIYALTHNEYQGNEHPGHCQFSSYYECWYNTIGLLRSDDAGQSFERVSKKPVAAPDFKQSVYQGKPRGFFGPSNIVRKNGYYYSMIRTTGSPGQPLGTCLFRAANPGEISSWSYFDGASFVPSARNPYEESTRGRPCSPLDNLLGNVTTVVRHGPTGLYMGVTEHRMAAGDQAGVYLLSTSSDLISWSEPRVLGRFPISYAKSCNDPYIFPYGTLIDPKSPSINFETVSDEPFFYLTRIHMQNCGTTLNRDLIRFKVKLVVE